VHSLTLILAILFRLKLSLIKQAIPSKPAMSVIRFPSARKSWSLRKHASSDHKHQFNAAHGKVARHTGEGIYLVVTNIKVFKILEMGIGRKAGQSIAEMVRDKKANRTE